MATTSYFSIVEFPGDGTTTEWDFNFAGGYISREHVKALSRDEFGAPTDIALDDTNFITESRLQIIPAIPVGHTLRIYRDTPKEEPLVDFTGGSNFTESNLDVLAQQTIFVAAEAFDAGAYAVANDLLGQAQTAASQANEALTAALQAEIDTALSRDQAAQSVVDAQAVVDAGAVSIGNQTTAAINSLNALSDSSEADLNAVATAQLAAMQLKVDAADQSADEAAASAMSVNPANLVHRTGDESIAGVKTFTSPPVVPAGSTGNSPPRAKEVPLLAAFSFGLRNKIINGNFNINQRGYVSGTATTIANQYTLDRWRVVVLGQNVTWVASGNGKIVTAPAGGIEQVIEGTFIEGGTFVLNWTGTASATVNGVAVVKGGTFTLPANTNATIKFSSGTVSLVQVEQGVRPSLFEHRMNELQLCQRYFSSTFPAGVAPQSGGTIAGGIVAMSGNAANAAGQMWCFPVEMRAVPAITTYNPVAAGSGWWGINNSQTPSCGVGLASNKSVELVITTAPEAFRRYVVHAAANAEL